MKRTLQEADGKHTIYYKDNGYEQHIKVYNDGTYEEWWEVSR